MTTRGLDGDDDDMDGGTDDDARHAPDSVGSIGRTRRTWS
jgi:hypothetical protein